MFGTIDVEWRRLRLPFAVCIAAALAGGAAVAAAWRHEHRITEGMEATEARLAETRGRYSALAEERRKWRRFGPLYRRLAAHGRLGEEQPVRWTEAVRRAATGALAARYRLASPHVVERSGPVEVRATDMSIDLDLRHEAELPVFIAALEREAPGLFTVSGCRLVRTEATRAEPPLPAAVGAACRIRWQSVVLAGVEPGWTPAAGTQDGDDAGDACRGRCRERCRGRPGGGEAGPCRADMGDLRPAVHDRCATRGNRIGPGCPGCGNASGRDPGRAPGPVRTAAAAAGPLGSRRRSGGPFRPLGLCLDRRPAGRVRRRAVGRSTVGKPGAARGSSRRGGALDRGAAGTAFRSAYGCGYRPHP